MAELCERCGLHRVASRTYLASDVESVASELATATPAHLEVARWRWRRTLALAARAIRGECSNCSAASLPAHLQEPPRG